MLLTFLLAATIGTASSALHARLSAPAQPGGAGPPECSEPQENTLPPQEKPSPWPKVAPELLPHSGASEAAPPTAPGDSGTTAATLGQDEGGAEIKRAATRWRSYDLQGHPEFTFHIYDPYHQNILKADYPIRGNWFVELNAFNNVIYKSRRNLDFSPVFADQIAVGKLKFVRQNQFFNENILFGAELRHNDDTFVPSNFRVRVNAVADYKHDINAFNDASNGSVHLFDAFLDFQLHDFGRKEDGHSNFDLFFVRGGLQGFKSEFHGLVFNDVGLGGRLFGELKKNRLRYDFAYLKLLQKNPLSGFIDLSVPSSHQVAIARFSWADLRPGWDSEWTFHYNRDHRNVPSSGTNAMLRANVDTSYVGASFNGHLGRFTFNPAVHGVFGHADSVQMGAAARHSVAAWMALADWQYKLDFWNFRLGYLYASGDGNPSDGRDTGFDAISDNVQLFGGPLSYWVGENIKFGNGDFVRANSLFPSFRGLNGAANYVNPGLHAFNAGLDMTLSPRFELAGNLNVLAFAATGIYTNRIVIAHHPAGIEENVFVRWKPFLREINQNVILDAGFSALQPLQGLQDAFRSARTVFSTFLAFRLVY